ncbi:helix-turn-helix domain-containing protein [uncultured Gordonia sp.]|uniref:helix-turn-helix domain-containing protein n=1 Tax=uncultured Gordonia sp. TaxID=198437 RepID=UPI0026259F41|nr:helix-turn-helix transcriptional regulator [uncultured Gordonia sp.]
MKRLRGKRSAQWLADQTGELGHPIPRTTISETENGRRTSITVQELVVLAQALGVPPIELLYPGVPDADTEVLPNDRRTAWQAAQWFSGEDRQGTATALARKRDALLQELAQAQNVFQRLGNAPRMRTQDIADWTQRIYDQLAEVEERMRAEQ